VDIPLIPTITSAIHAKPGNIMTLIKQAACLAHNTQLAAHTQMESSVFVAARVDTPLIHTMYSATRAVLLDSTMIQANKLATLALRVLPAAVSKMVSLLFAVVFQVKL
jgi:hypothetical protein